MVIVAVTAGDVAQVVLGVSVIVSGSVRAKVVLGGSVRFLGFLGIEGAGRMGVEADCERDEEVGPEEVGPESMPRPSSMLMGRLEGDTRTVNKGTRLGAAGLVLLALMQIDLVVLAQAW